MTDGVIMGTNVSLTINHFTINFLKQQEGRMFLHPVNKLKYVL